MLSYRYHVLSSRDKIPVLETHDIVEDRVDGGAEVVEKSRHMEKIPAQCAMLGNERNMSGHKSISAASYSLSVR